VRAGIDEGGSHGRNNSPVKKDRGRDVFSRLQDIQSAA
jgi:hypothetical protein